MEVTDIRKCIPVLAAFGLALAAGAPLIGCGERETPQRGIAAGDSAVAAGGAARSGIGDSRRPSAARRDTVYFFMSRRGHDANSGSRERPAATLERIHELVSRASPEADVVVKIRSDAGVYYDQSVVWTYYRPEYSITIEADPPGKNARFEAGETPPTRPFFGLSAMRGEPTNITLRGLTVRNYISRAVLFLGDRETRGNWNGRNSIERCVFENIGNARSPAQPIVYSAVGVVNSRNNRIVGCTFVDIKNHTLANFTQDASGAERELPPEVMESALKLRAIGPGSNPNIPIVGVYFAHYSDSNAVEGCEFKRIKGDPIRIRDDSNGNVIANNRFELAGWNAIVSTWYCDSPRQNCVKEFGFEKISMGNAILNNTVSGNWRGGMPRIFFDMRAPEGVSGREPPSPLVMRIEGNVLDVYR